LNILNPLSPESSTLSVSLCLLLSVHSSLIFRGFSFCRFENSRGRPNNKNMSLGPLNEQEHQYGFTTRTGVRAIPQYVPRSWREKDAVPTTVFLQRRNPTPSLKILQYCFGKGGRAIMREFSLSAGGLET
jgi:hypothetical protein